MDIHYVLMLDGRELPGISTNPDDEMLSGAGYHGRQEHERDGAAYYWGTRSGSKSDMTEQYGDMTSVPMRKTPSTRAAIMHRSTLTTSATTYTFTATR